MNPFWRILGFTLLAILLLTACQGREEKEPDDSVTFDPLPPGLHQETATLPSGDMLRYTILVPESYQAETPVPLIVALHYGGQVTPFYGRGMIDYLVAPALGELGAILVAPDARGGSGWTAAQNEEAVLWLTRSLVNSYAIDPDRILLTGYSMGGRGTWYIGSRNQDLFSAALPISGGPEGGSVEWKIPVYVIHSVKDEVMPFPATEAHVQKLRDQGASIELRVMDNLTHYDTDAFAIPLREARPWVKVVWGAK